MQTCSGSLRDWPLVRFYENQTEAGYVHGRYETNSEEMIQMEISGVIVLAVGLGICAAVGLFGAQAAGKRDGVDRAGVEMPKTAERYRYEDRE